VGSLIRLAQCTLTWVCVFCSSFQSYDLTTKVIVSRALESSSEGLDLGLDANILTQVKTKIWLNGKVMYLFT